MAQINVCNLTFSYEDCFDNIFENVSFSIDTDWKLGFIGRNGKGKTTFARLLLGKEEYKGSIITSGTVFDYFPYLLNDEQMGRPEEDYSVIAGDEQVSISTEDSSVITKDKYAGCTASELLESMKPGCEEWRVICELDKMNSDAELLYRPFNTLSHGERTRVMLAVLFSGENDFLIIDEPTNHLDSETRETVKEYLKSKSGFILISHDRNLLDAVTDHVLVLNRKSITVQQGNFTTWWENKQKQDAFSKAENEKHLKEIDLLRQSADRAGRWAEKNENTKIGFNPIKEHDRFKNTRSYIGAKTKKMQSRVNNFEKRIEWEIEEKEGLLNDIEETVDLKLFPQKYHKDILIFGRDFSFSYPNSGKMILKHFDFELKQGERVFLHGCNGCGKSTLIKLILGELEGVQGSLSVPENLKISYINQDTGFLKGDLFDYCEKQKLDESLFLAILRQMDMNRIQFAKPMESYSEGQKKKVLIASSLLTSANLYIWDEPLNYIDVFSRMQIEKLILEFKPTMLVVDHDVAFRERVATRVVEFNM